MPPRTQSTSRRPRTRPRGARVPGHERAHPATGNDLTPVLGANLRRLRSRRSLSLEKLAKLSGVSRAMLGQIELGQSAPTVNVLWKISTALEVPFSALITSRPAASLHVLRVDQLAAVARLGDAPGAGHELCRGVADAEGGHAPGSQDARLSLIHI